MGRAPFNSEVGLERGPWTAKEDALLSNYIQEHGEGRWSKVPQKAGLQRCGKSCRLRWLNYLRPGLKRGNFSPEEDDLIIRLHKLLGNRWCLIAKRLPGRTDNEIKNYWNSHLSKRLLFQKISQTDQPKPSTDGKYNKKKKHTNINPEHANDKETTNTSIYLPKPSRVFPFVIPITRNNSFDSMLEESSFSYGHGEGNITRSTINDTEALNSLIPPLSDLAVAAAGGNHEQRRFDNECDYSFLDDLLFKEEYHHNMFYKIYKEYQEVLMSSENHVVQAGFSWVDPFLA